MRFRNIIAGAVIAAASIFPFANPADATVKYCGPNGSYVSVLTNAYAPDYYLGWQNKSSSGYTVNIKVYRFSTLVRNSTQWVGAGRFFAVERTGTKIIVTPFCTIYDGSVV